MSFIRLFDVRTQSNVIINKEEICTVVHDMYDRSQSVVYIEDKMITVKENMTQIWEMLKNE